MFNCKIIGGVLRKVAVACGTQLCVVHNYVWFTVMCGSQLCVVLLTMLPFVAAEVVSVQTRHCEASVDATSVRSRVE
jgi:hypothetical protein